MPTPANGQTSFRTSRAPHHSSRAIRTHPCSARMGEGSTTNSPREHRRREQTHRAHSISTRHRIWPERKLQHRPAASAGSIAYPTVDDHRYQYSRSQSPRHSTNPNTGVDLNNYVSERHWATADDGTNVPYDIVRHKDHRGALPAVVYAYGSYEISLPPWFSVSRLSLLTVDSPGCLYTPRRR